MCKHSTVWDFVLETKKDQIATYLSGLVYIWVYLFE